MATDVPIHYLKPNERNWSPAARIVLAVDTTTVVPGEREVLGLRCWSANYTDRRPPRRGTVRVEHAHGQSPESLADQLECWMSGRDSVWLYAHELAMVLTVCRLHRTMRARGWRVSDFSLSGSTPWLTLRRARKTLTVVDPASWLPLPVPELAARTRQAPPPDTPAGGDDTTDGYRTDALVRVVGTAMDDLMEWWDAGKLGNWTLTGPATGWNAHRHIGGDVRVVIDADPEKMAHDRTAARGGRRGVWSVGEHAAGPFAELDFVSAYPTIAAHRPLPRCRAFAFDHLSLGDPALNGETWGVLADVRIKASEPRWPVRLHGVTWYPLGEFRTPLAQPDITEAARLGALVEIGPGWAHQLAPHLATWARWVLATLAAPEGTVPEVARIAAKHWSRTVIGRYASRGFRVDPLGPAPTLDWHYEPGWDARAQRDGGLLDIDGKRYWVVSDGAPENAYPAVTAWVESEVRVRLGRAIAAIGDGAVLQCDTDGLIVSLRTVGTRAAHGHLIAPAGLTGTGRLNWVLDQIEPVVSPLVLRVKRMHQHVHVDGPQRYSTPAQRKFAGMPRAATETEPGTWRGHDMPGLKWQLEHGDPAGYVRRTRTYRPRPVNLPGWALDDNRVVPVTMEIGPDGANRIVPWRHSIQPERTGRLADHQHPALDALR